MPAAPSSCRVSSPEKRRSGPRSSVSLSDRRRRCSPSPGSLRVPSRTCTCEGSRAETAPASEAPRPTTARADRRSRAPSAPQQGEVDKSRSTTASPRKLGDGLTHPRTRRRRRLRTRRSPTARSAGHHARRARPKPRRPARGGPRLRPTTAAAPTCHSRQARRPERPHPNEPLTTARRAPAADKTLAAPAGAPGFWRVGGGRSTGPACNDSARPGRAATRDPRPATHAKHPTTHEACQARMVGGPNRRHVYAQRPPTAAFASRRAPIFALRAERRGRSSALAERAARLTRSCGATRALHASGARTWSGDAA